MTTPEQPDPWTSTDEQVGPACMNIVVPSTIATAYNDDFRTIYSQGYRHAIADARKQLATERAQHQQELLRLENVEIDRQQTLQRMERAGQLLVALPFWPSTTTDINATRDIGRILLGQTPECSTGYDEIINAAGAFALSWKAQVIALTTERDTLNKLIAGKDAEIDRLDNKVDVLRTSASSLMVERDTLKVKLDGIVPMPHNVLSGLAGEDVDKQRLLAEWDIENELRHAAESALATMTAERDALKATLRGLPPTLAAGMIERQGAELTRLREALRQARQDFGMVACDGSTAGLAASRIDAALASTTPTT